MAELQELIPGYQLTRLLGRGGFGEVWEAIAPGGVAKAVKFVFDQRADGRSEQELRSLNRIKNVRHPFVLSVERIERRDDRLVIVTELGEMNLKERFEEREADGHRGIAVDELLRLLHDAAEALDYIYAEFGLQHLDVKPENLLLFGQHLKVADFGLVKNIYDRSVSVINAMTPVYSAPELVEGRPGRSTDQYALAIVYQHMLTGRLPFDGLTAAQLAAQHLRDVPDLSAVPERQRPVLARALSKEPTQRFGSCAELIDALSATRHLSEKPSKAAPVRAAALPDRTAPMPARDTGLLSASGEETREVHQRRPSPTGGASSPAASEDGDATRPTIVIGVGGAGGRVLQGFRRRVRERHASSAEFAGLRLLQIDSDTADLTRTSHAREGWGETVSVPVPLLASAEYRTSANKFRTWLNRNWLFNVPRDLRTHGMRPLGRLALLSHAPRVRKTLRETIRGVGEAPAQVGTSNGAGPGPCRLAPRVLIVGSISGGTASGTLLDLAYLARHELKAAGWFDATVDGALLLAEPVGRQREQAIAGSCAFLSEQAHFSRNGGFYPGSPELEVPPFHGDNRTFDRTYVLDLGSSDEASHPDGRIDDVAEFLYQSAVRSGGVPAPWAGEAADGEAELVDVTQLAPPTGRFVEGAAWQLCVDVVDSLRGTYRADSERSNATAADVTVLIESLADPETTKLTNEASLSARFDEAGIRVAALVADARAATEAGLGRPGDAYLRQLIDEGLDRLPSASSGRSTGFGLLLDAVDELFQAPDDADHGGSSMGHLFGAVCDRVSPGTQRTIEGLVGRIRGLTDTFGVGVNGALAVAEASTDRVRQLQREVARLMDDHADLSEELRTELAGDPSSAGSTAASRFSWLRNRRNQRADLQAREKLVDYGLQGIERFAAAIAFKQLRTIEVALVELTDSLQRLWQDLKRLHGLCVRGSAGGQSPEEGRHWRPVDRLEQCLFEAFRGERASLVRRAYQAVGADVLTGERRLERFLDGRADLCDEVSDPLYAQCRSVVLRWIEAVVEESLVESKAQAHSPEFRLDSAVAELLASKGGSNYLVVVPERADCAALQCRLGRLGHDVAVIPGKVSGVAVVEHEARASLAALATLLSARTESPDRTWQLARTLHARNDVAWGPSAASETFAAFGGLENDPAAGSSLLEC